MDKPEPEELRRWGLVFIEVLDVDLVVFQHVLDDLEPADLELRWLSCELWEVE